MRMKSIVSLAIVVICVLLISTLNRVHGAGPADHMQKIAVYRTFEIMQKMQEAKIVQEGLVASDNQRTADLKRKSDEVTELAHKADQMNKNHPSFQEVADKIEKGSIEFEVMKRAVEIKSQREKRKALYDMFMKIETAAKAIAQDDKIDLVVADNKQELYDLDRATYDGLMLVLSQRDIAFASKDADITDRVLTRLDADFANSRKLPGH